MSSSTTPATCRIQPGPGALHPTKWFTVLAQFTTDEETNAHLENHPTHALLCEIGGVRYIARATDLGTDSEVIPKPVITFKKFTYSPSLSEETNAYTADVYVDGEFGFTASNHGTGGDDEYRPRYLKGHLLRGEYDRAMAKLQAYADAQPGSHGLGGGRVVDVESMVSYEAENLIAAQCKKEDIAKIQKSMATKAYMLDPKDNSVRTWTFRVGPITQRYYDVIKEKHPTLKPLTTVEAIYDAIFAFQSKCANSVQRELS